jgi:hypothetical protein
MKIHGSIMVFAFWAMLASEPFSKQDKLTICPEAKIYVNRNQIDYGPLRLPHIKGKGVVNRDSKFAGQPVGGACLSLFTENTHKWIETQIADSEGKFIFGSIKPGRYRLIARGPSLCPANIPLIIIKPNHSQITHSMQLLISFIADAIYLDKCSFGELVKSDSPKCSLPVYKNHNKRDR